MYLAKGSLLGDEGADCALWLKIAWFDPWCGTCGSPSTRDGASTTFDWNYFNEFADGNCFFEFYTYYLYEGGLLKALLLFDGLWKQALSAGVLAPLSLLP